VSEGLVRVQEQCEAVGAAVAVAWFDVVDETATTAAVRELSAKLGPLRGLVNNAGYQGRFAPIDRYPLDEARRVVEVNAIGAINVLAVVSRSMIEAHVGGAIVNTASMAGVSGAPNMSAYSASKAAVIGLTKSAAKDLAPAGIRVNSVSPAFIGPGRMWDSQVAGQAEAGSQYYADEPAAVAEQMIGLVPLRRYGSTDEVARVVAFLLSDEASYLTGLNVEIAGGSV
jgi:NAD(P)-dependent dehydrogenase (short-subunit alcohol dehydrogenase family)